MSHVGKVVLISAYQHSRSNMELEENGGPGERAEQQDALVHGTWRSYRKGV